LLLCYLRQSQVITRPLRQFSANPRTKKPKHQAETAMDICWPYPYDTGRLMCFAQVSIHYRTQTETICTRIGTLELSNSRSLFNGPLPTQRMETTMCRAFRNLHQHNLRGICSKVTIILITYVNRNTLESQSDQSRRFLCITTSTAKAEALPTSHSSNQTLPPKLRKNRMESRSMVDR